MSSRVFYYITLYLAILTHNKLCEVKGQSTVQGSQQEDLSNPIIAEIEELNKIQEDINITNLQIVERRSPEQVQHIYELLNTSFQQLRNRLDTVDTRLQEQDTYIKQIANNHEILTASLVAIDRRLKKHANFVRKKTGIILIQLLTNSLGQVSTKTDRDKLPELHNSSASTAIADAKWVVIMHRFDGSLNFNGNWTDYRNGFGDKKRGEFWLGNEEVHRLTNRGPLAFKLRIEMQLRSSEQWYYAEYSTFSLESENNKYTLRVSGYSGNAGDALTNNTEEIGRYLVGMGFTTKDSDNDRMSYHNCAVAYSGGWWYNDCRYFYSCLTCYYQYTFKWHNPNRSNNWPTSGLLRAARMMIKSK